MTSLSKVLRKYGQEAQLKKRVEKKIDYQTVYEYSDPILVRGQFLQITPYDIQYQTFGRVEVGDWIATFKPDVDISEGDLIILDNDTLEVQNVILRKHGSKTMYKEVLLRKKK
jgi:ASC-1-like (ASCH) protein